MSRTGYKVHIICRHANSPVKSVFFCQAQTSLKIFPSILDCFARPISKFPPNLVFCLFLPPAESVRNHGYRNRYNLMDCGHKEITFICFQKRSLIKEQLPVYFTRQQFKFLKRFSELIKKKYFLFLNYRFHLDYR